MDLPAGESSRFGTHHAERRAGEEAACSVGHGLSALARGIAFERSVAEAGRAKWIEPATMACWWRTGDAITVVVEGWRRASHTAVRETAEIDAAVEVRTVIIKAGAVGGGEV